MNTDQVWPRALVVGASSGIGESIARQLGRQGTQVALVSRRAERLEQICGEINSSPAAGHARFWTHDVRSHDEVASLFQEIATELGGLDLVVYAAGIMPRLSIGEYPSDRDVETVDTNLTGAILWLNEAARRFAAARSGTIVGVSSIAGDRGRVANPVYNASKAALNTYLESLRNRLARRGVTVVTVRPGYVRTQQTENLALPRFLPVASSDEAARLILVAAAKGKRIAYIPRWWRIIGTVIRLVPAPVMEHINL